MKLVSLYSTIKVMHGPINIRLTTPILALNIRILFINVSYIIVPSLMNTVALSYTSDTLNLVSWMERGTGSERESLLSTRRIKSLLESFKVLCRKRRQGSVNIRSVKCHDKEAQELYLLYTSGRLYRDGNSLHSCLGVTFRILASWENTMAEVPGIFFGSFQENFKLVSLKNAKSPAFKYLPINSP